MRNRLDASIEAMAQQYREFSYSESSAAGTRRSLWVGTVSPLAQADGKLLLIDDLYHDAPVYIQAGAIYHWEGCKRQHCEHGLRLRRGDASKPFTLSVTYDGTAALPRCRVIDPMIRFGTPHVWQDDAICALLASEWDYEKQTVADIMDDHLIWLVKWMVWKATGCWIGAEHRHSPLYHFWHVPLRGTCWCGSGRQYRRCHLRPELAEFARLRKSQNRRGPSFR